ncbi:hypothetical protein [Microtetraspora malaysiensis]|uniref:hypothetical protein n=1 Tax=Microtetraspora malaysiensis TaxID=161358 RepID=UPI00082F638D|nr:hypothetical protein [Microtetraspora malaysiensis]
MRLSEEVTVGAMVGLLPPTAGPLMLIAKVLAVTAGALIGMARTPSAGALPPAAEALVQAALAVTARTPQARMLLVVIAG